MTVAKLMGYSSLSGLARVKLSALRKYGLLEAVANGHKISDLALQILLAPTDSERDAGLREAALRPAIFRSVYETYAEASDAVLLNHLVRERDFSEDGAKQFIKALRSTVETAKLGDAAEPATAEPEARTSIPEGTPIETDRPAGGQNTMLLNVPYRDTSLTVRISVAGDALTRRHLAKIRKYLQLVEEDLADDGGDPQAN